MILKCLQCQKEFERKKTGRIPQYCSRDCRRIKNEKNDRGIYYKRLYGISYEDYEELFRKQNGKCAICGTDDPLQGKNFLLGKARFPVDHDHQTGIIRGLLCSRCNRGIGLFEEDPVILQKAIEYLEKSKR